MSMQPGDPPSTVRSVGRMYPAGYILEGFQPLGSWPEAGNNYIVGHCPRGVAVNSVKTGKTLLLSWSDLCKLSASEGLLIDDVTPEGVRAGIRPGLPGDEAQEKRDGTSHSDERGTLRPEGTAQAAGDPGVGPDGGHSPAGEAQAKVAGWAGTPSPG